jgi:hypothetical protein
VAIALFAVFVLRPALRDRPQPQGDSAEYFFTSESLLNHGTPLLQQEDLDSLGELARRHGREEELAFPSSLFVASPEGVVQGVHFWAYPLATLPASVLLRALGQYELKAPQITNALLLLAALVHVLYFSRIYDPDHEVFRERTLHEECPPAGLVVFVVEGRCRKALLQSRHRRELTLKCGPWRRGPDFRALKATKGRDAWAYVNY